MAVASGALLPARYDALVCDLDGVVYRGAEAVPGAPAALQRVVAAGARLVYATNNASRTPATVAEQLTRLGAPGSAADVLSSAQAGAEHLRTELGAGVPVLALGGDGVRVALVEAGLVPVAPTDVTAVAAVLQGFGPDVTVADLETAARVIGEGARWVATNTDATLPREWGQAPGNGAYVDLLRAATGRGPHVVGKPEAPLYELCVRRLGTASGRTLAVGDRLETDVVGAVRAGLDSAWVLTGVDRPSDLLVRRELPAPTHVVAGVGDLLAPLPDVVDDGDAFSCGEATAWIDGEVLVLDERDAPPLDALRAGLAAALVLRDAGAGPAALSRPGERLDGLATRAVEATAG